MTLSYFMVLAIGLWLGKRQAMKGLHVGVEIQQECVLFPLFFIVYMNWGLGGTNAATLMSTSRSKIAQSVAYYLLMI